jgi:hypothetical protein
MPTGYTSDIKDGITFKQYAMSCARAFAACVTMKDEPFDAKIPEFKPSEYHAEKVIELHKELELIENMSIKEASARAKKEHEESVRSENEFFQGCTDLRKKYENMLVQVEAWEPPSTDHIEYKEFMISQIKQSIDFDCHEPDKDGEHTYGYVPKMSGDRWKNSKISEIKESIEYHKKEDKAERERVANRNRWIRKLCESFDRMEMSDREKRFSEIR